MDYDVVATITRFASGDITLREPAIMGYRQLRRLGVPVDSHPALGFMSQIDTDHPDIKLRRQFRADLIKFMETSGQDQSITAVSRWHRETLSKFMP